MSASITAALALASSLPLLGLAAQSDTTERPPDVTTYAGIDASLAGRVVLEPDAIWRFFPGSENPSPKFEWAKGDFDDSSWREGTAPFGFGPDYSDLGTTLGEQVSTLYLRRTIELPNRSDYSRILIELPVDDGYVLFVNGRDEDRLHADITDFYHAFDGSSTLERSSLTPPCPTVNLTPMLKDGVNTLALQVLSYKKDRESLAIYPRVRIEYAMSPEGERARRAQLRSALEAAGGDNAARLAYLEGRHLQRIGEPVRAIAALTRATELDPSGPETWGRLVEAHRAAGSLADLEAAWMSRLGEGGQSIQQLNAWAEFALNDLSVSVVDFAARDFSSIGESAQGVEVGHFADALWAGRLLGAGQGLVIACGAEGEGARDHGYGAGTEARSIDGDSSIFRTLRVCSRNLDDLEPAYRIPLAPGAYWVILTIGPSDGEQRVAGDVVFDVSVEDARVARSVDPLAGALGDDGGGSGATRVRFPVFVLDGFLDVDLLPHTRVDPWLTQIEVQPVGSDRDGFEADVVAWIAETGRSQAFPLVQLAELAQTSNDQKMTASLYGEAERLPDFGPDQRERLGRLRDAWFPTVLSFAAVDDLVQRRVDESQAMLEAVRASGTDADVIAYFEGRVHQREGHVDDAIAGFEQVVFGDGKASLPVLRMAESLAAVPLAHDALDIMADAIDGDVERTPAMLQLWISLQLGPLRREPWDVIADLADMDVPDELIVVPSSEFSAQQWNITNGEPPANAWSRAGYDDSTWHPGLGMLGSGNTNFGSPRSHSNKEMVFGRQHFYLAEASLLYPYFDVNANDAGEVYLNGTKVSTVSVSTHGWVQMPVRPAPFLTGENLLGEFGFNSRNESLIDVGILQPLGELIWIKSQLDAHGALRINCGGEALQTADGKQWAADRFYGWALGHSDQGDAEEIAGTEIDEIYRTNRWFYDDTTTAFYQVPLPNQAYHVTLHFAEIDAAWSEPGARVVDIRLEDKQVFEDLDIVSEVGFQTAFVREFDVEVFDGWLDLLINDFDYRTYISALEIEVVSED